MRHPLWWLRHHLPLRKRWDNKTFTTGLRPRKTGQTRFARWKSIQPPYRRGKCTPSAYGTSPGGGGLLYASLSTNLSCSIYSAARTSPSGESTAAGGDRGAFPLGRRPGWFVFPSRQGRGCKGFIIRGVLNELKDANYRRASGMYNSSPPKAAIPQPSRQRRVKP